MTRRVLVVANATDSDPGFVGDRLVERGYVLDTVHREEEPLPDDPGDAALLLLLGSEWSVHAPVRPEVRDAEAVLVRSARNKRVPVLGLCYGAQLVAHALGGRVEVAVRPEAGLVEVETQDPAYVPAGPWTAFHRDALTPPPGAAVLARNTVGVQAFAVPGVLAVQFHPEVRPAVLAGWADRFPDLVLDAGGDHESLLASVHGREETSRRAAADLVDAFLARVPPWAQGDALAAQSSSP